MILPGSLGEEEEEESSLLDIPISIGPSHALLIMVNPLARVEIQKSDTTLLSTFIISHQGPHADIILLLADSEIQKTLAGVVCGKLKTYV